MGSGSNSPSGLDTAASSLEIALDQAIAQRFASAQERASRKRRHSPAPMSSAPMSSAPMSSALTVSAKETALALFPPRLYWRGIAVSEEFQQYAARVASGEQLGPYRGDVLSRYCPNFPWTESTASLDASTAPTPTLPKYPERRRSLKTTLWLVASVGSITAALGFGAGATAIDARDDEALDFQPFRVTAALSPARAAASPAELESREPDGELAGSTAAASLATQDQSEPIATAVAGARQQLAPSSNLPRTTEARAPSAGVDRASVAARVVGSAATQGATRALGTAPVNGTAAPSGTALAVGAVPRFGTATGVTSATPGVAALRSPYAATPAYPSTTPYAPIAAYGSAAPASGSLPGVNRPTIARPPAAPFAGAAPATVGGAANAPAGAPRAAEIPSRDTALFSDRPSF